MDAMARIGVMHHKHEHQPKDLPPHGQMGVLFVVSHQGPISIKDISQRFGMTSSAATQLVTSLVKAGLLARKEDDSDRRKVGIILTAQGKKILEKAKEHRMNKMSKMFATLSDTELEQLGKIQAKIVEHWEKTCKDLQHKQK